MPEQDRPAAAKDAATARQAGPPPLPSHGSAQAEPQDTTASLDTDVRMEYVRYLANTDRLIWFLIGLVLSAFVWAAITPAATLLALPTAFAVAGLVIYLKRQKLKHKSDAFVALRYNQARRRRLITSVVVASVLGVA